MPQAGRCFPQRLRCWVAACEGQRSGILPLWGWLGGPEGQHVCGDGHSQRRLAPDCGGVCVCVFGWGVAGVWLGSLEAGTSLFCPLLPP